MNKYFVVPVLVAVMMAVGFAQVTATRELSSSGATISMRVENPAQGVVIVSESLPESCSLKTSDPVPHKVAGGNLSWVFYGNDVVDRDITYEVSGCELSPDTVSGYMKFSTAKGVIKKEITTSAFQQSGEENTSETEEKSKSEKEDSSGGLSVPLVAGIVIALVLAGLAYYWHSKRAVSGSI